MRHSLSVTILVCGPGFEASDGDWKLGVTSGLELKPRERRTPIEQQLSNYNITLYWSIPQSIRFVLNGTIIYKMHIIQIFTKVPNQAISMF